MVRIPSSSQASVIAARKLLYVCGSFRALAPLKGEGGGSAARRMGNRPRRISRIAGRQRHAATPRGAPPRRLLRPWDLTSGSGASELAIQAGFRPPFTCPVQPLKAAPRSGHGRLPKAPRVRGTTSSPRPQAPHPAPRYKRPGNAPRVGRDGNECIRVGIFVKRGKIKFFGVGVHR